MKTIERLMKVYIAEDGTEFLTEYQCESYEEDLLKSKQRCEFLNKTILEEMKKIHGIIKWPKDMIRNIAKSQQEKQSKVRYEKYEKYERISIYG